MGFQDEILTHNLKLSDEDGLSEEEVETGAEEEGEEDEFGEEDDLEEESLDELAEEEDSDGEAGGWDKDEQ